MATLEVHDGKGKVEYVSIPREGTALIGSDPKCDVVLSGPGVLPIHARLRWKRGRWKVEATPRSLLRGGQRQEARRLEAVAGGTRSSSRGTRIFLLNEGEGSAAAAAAEPTLVREAPPRRRGSSGRSRPFSRCRDGPAFD